MNEDDLHFHPLMSLVIERTSLDREVTYNAEWHDKTGRKHSMWISESTFNRLHMEAREVAANAS